MYDPINTSMSNNDEYKRSSTTKSRSNSNELSSQKHKKNLQIQQIEFDIKFYNVANQMNFVIRSLLHL